jgi:hypothetical protein
MRRSSPGSPSHSSDAVAVAGRDVAVEAVVRDVELAVGEPLRERRVRPVEHLGERGVPVQAPGLLGPEAVAVGIRLRVEIGGGDGIRGELGEGANRRVSFSRWSIWLLICALLCGGGGIGSRTTHEI